MCKVVYPWQCRSTQAHSPICGPNLCSQPLHLNAAVVACSILSSQLFVCSLVWKQQQQQQQHILARCVALVYAYLEIKFWSTETRWVVYSNFRSVTIQWPGVEWLLLQCCIWNVREAMTVSLSEIWVGQLGSISGGETGSRSRRGSPSSIPTESAVSLLLTHSHTRTLSGLLRLQNYDLTKTLIIVNWTFPHSLLNYSFCYYDFSRSFMRMQHASLFILFLFSSRACFIHL